MNSQPHQMSTSRIIDVLTRYLDYVHLPSAPARADLQISNVMRVSADDVSDAPISRVVHWRLCLHEAAHAVVYKAFGTQVNLARVVKSHACGFIEHVSQPDALSDAIGTLAGVMAELKYGVDSERQNEFSSCADVLQAARKVSEIPFPIDHRTVTTLTAATVAAHWAEINRVAAALHESGTLTREEIDALCRRDIPIMARSFSDSIIH